MITLITCDSIWGAIDYISGGRIKYNVGIIDRYIFYMLVWIIGVFFNASPDPLFYILAIPKVCNWIIESPLYSRVGFYKEKLIKIIASKIFVMVIRKYLDRKVKISWKDIGISSEGVLMILKPILIAIGLMGIKRRFKTVYYAITKYLYTFKYGEIINSFNEEMAKELLIINIRQKNWEEFLKPNTCGAIIYLIQNKNDSVIDYNYFLQISAIWTLSSIFTSEPCIAALILYWLINWIRGNMNYSGVKTWIFSWIIGVGFRSNLITAIGCVLGEKIIECKPVRKMIKYIKSRNDNIDFIASCGLIASLGIYGLVASVFNVIVNWFRVGTIELFGGIGVVLGVAGYFSDYAIGNVVLNGLLLYLLNLLVNLKNLLVIKKENESKVEEKEETAVIIRELTESITYHKINIIDNFLD